MPRRLQVELPVCPECGQVGKLPFADGLKGFCVGAAEKGTAHKKQRMVPVVFKDAVPVEAGGVA